MTDEGLTALYNEANGITGKRMPITTARIFTAIRAAIAAEREACAKVCEEESLRGLPDDPTHDGILQIVCGVAIASAIRERSNAELRGGPAASSPERPA